MQCTCKYKAIVQTKAIGFVILRDCRLSSLWLCGTSCWHCLQRSRLSLGWLCDSLACLLVKAVTGWLLGSRFRRRSPTDNRAHNWCQPSCTSSTSTVHRPFGTRLQTQRTVYTSYCVYCSSYIVLYCVPFIVDFPFNYYNYCHFCVYRVYTNSCFYCTIVLYWQQYQQTSSSTSDAQLTK